MGQRLLLFALLLVQLLLHNDPGLTMLLVLNTHIMGDIWFISEVKQSYGVMPRGFQHIQPSNSDSYAADKS